MFQPHLLNFFKQFIRAFAAEPQRVHGRNVPCAVKTGKVLFAAAALLDFAVFHSSTPRISVVSHGKLGSLGVRL